MTRRSNMVWRQILVGLCVTAVLASCGQKDDTRVLFDGMYYKAKTKSVSKDERKAFETVVRRPEKGINGALAAGEHDAKIYCLTSFGTSEIAWTRGPADPNAERYAESGSLVLNGSCVLW